MADFATILVTTDLSDPSVTALRQAVQLADSLGSRLILAYVVEDRLPPLVLAHATDMGALIQEHRERAETAIRKHVEEHLAGRDVETVIRQGWVHEEIVQLAEERKADLIVIGMHGHGFLTHALVGSTTERVLHHAPCPVLVVPHS